MKHKRLLLLIPLVFFLAQTGNFACRSYTVIREDMRSWGDSGMPGKIDEARILFTHVMWADIRGKPRPQFPCPDDDASPDVDQDHDGLSARAELWQLTSDTSPDTDADGLSDAEDPCPNCFVSTYREQLESLVARTVLNRGSSTTLTYCVTRLGSHWEVVQPGGRVVPIDEIAFYYLRLRTDVFPFEHSSDTGYLQIHTMVFVPGVFHVYRTHYWCGTLCAVGTLEYFVDLPFVGVVHIASKVLEVS